jgi:hypothetical protein
MAVLLWIFICYAFLTYMPAFARAVALGVALVGIWCLFLLGSVAKTAEEVRNTTPTLFLHSWCLLRCRVENNWRGSLGKAWHSMHTRERCL